MEDRTQQGNTCIRPIVRAGWIAIAVFSLAGWPLAALNPQLHPSEYTLDRWGWALGIPEETISGILQTPEGLLWIAHANGLVRFNGTVAVASHWPAAVATDRSVRVLARDREGNLWAMTVSGTVLRVGAKAFHSPEGTPVEIVYTADPKWRIPTREAAIAPIRGGIRVNGPNGLMDMETTGERPQPKKIAPKEGNLPASGFDAEGALWRAESDGSLVQWTAGSGARRIGTLPARRYDRILVAARERIWLRSKDTLHCWCQDRHVQWPLPEGFSGGSAYEPIIEDSQGTVWLGGRGRVLRFRDGQFASADLPPDLAEAPVTALFEDREGSLWVGTLGGDLMRFQDSAVTSIGRTEGLAGDIVNAVLSEANGDVWAHSMNAGITHLRGDKKETIPLQDGSLWYLARDPRSGHLISGAAISRYRIIGNSARAMRDPVAETQGPATGWWLDPESKDYLVGRTTGLYRQDSLDAPSKVQKLSVRGGAQTFARGEGGVLWAADSQSLLEWTPAGEVVVWPPERTPDESIHIILWDPGASRLWVGTSRGLLLWDPQTRRWGARGMPGDSFFALQFDNKGMLWAGTRNGIVKIDPAQWMNGWREAQLRLTHAEGLRSLNFGMCRGQGSTLLGNGTILFASMKGLVALNPANLSQPRYGPTPLITELLADEKATTLAARTPMGAGVTRVKVSFEAFSISSPREVSVSYQLEGVDNAWQPAGTRRAIQYTNLGPGNYRFRLRSSWPDGSGAREASVEWQIEPHFYQTAWFQLTSLTVLLTLVILAIQRRSRIIAQRTAELEARVADRTRELEAAKASAEEAAKVKSAFLAAMSHELRTPMNGVLGIAELLSSTELNKTQAELLQTLRTSGESLLAIVNDVLDLSKIDAGRLELERIPVSVPAMLEGLGDLVRPLAAKKGLALEIVSRGEELPWIEGDPSRIRQILLNLLSNAIKFTNEGRIRLTAQWGEGTLSFLVEDTGIGIPREKLPMLFQHFVQLDSSTTRLFGGTGLGLAICRRLVEAMGGQIDCESTAGSGSVFTVCLPVVPAAPPAPSIVESQPILQPGLRVLVAEDNPTNQFVILGLLRKLGIEAEMAANGEEAVERCQKKEYDLVLMDCQMPVLDGYEATRRIRASKGSAAPPIVALTAHALESDREECLAAGMCDYITKPIVVAHLRHVINEYCPHRAPLA